MTHSNRNNKKSQNNYRSNTRANKSALSKSGENISKHTNITIHGNMPAAAYSGARALNYPGRLRERSIPRNNTKKQKFYNTRRVIVSGKELTTPIRKRTSVAKLSDAVENKPEVKITVKTINKEKAKLPVSLIFYILATTCVLLCLSFSQMVLNEYTNKINDANTRIGEAQKEEIMLSSQLEAKDNWLEFEKIAVEKLGMIKEDLLPKKYVSLKNKDKVEIISDSEGIFTKISNMFPQIFLAPNEE